MFWIGLGVGFLAGLGGGLLGFVALVYWAADAEGWSGWRRRDREQLRPVGRVGG